MVSPSFPVVLPESLVFGLYHHASLFILHHCTITFAGGEHLSLFNISYSAYLHAYCGGDLLVVRRGHLSLFTMKVLPNVKT